MVDLGSSELFASLPLCQRHQLELRARRRKCAARAVIYTPGDTARALYLVQQGCVKLARQTLEGREVVLHLLIEGETFGEEALIDEASPETSSSRGLTAQAVTDTLLLEIPVLLLKSWLEESVPFLKSLLKMTLRREQQLASQVEELAFKDVTARLAGCLLVLSGPDCRPVILTHEEIGHLIASTRETVTCAVDTLRKQGWVETKGRTIRISDPAALRERSLVACPPRPSR
jgi:CRP/FNR family cyclic AMP-dependent transcriptional regulator